VTLFRKHLSHVRVCPATTRSLSIWKARTKNGQYYISYDVGKSAVRVIKGTVPCGVHCWKLPPNCALVSCSAIMDARLLDVSRVFKCEDVVILHYVVCGYSWWKKKYEILRCFPNYWFGGKLKIPPCFHLDSRDVYLEGNEEKMQTFYKNQIVFDNLKEKEAQLESGMCIRNSFPQKVLSDGESHSQSTNTSITTNAPGTLIEKKDNNPSAQKQLPQDGPPSILNTLSLEKQWIIGSLVSQYLGNEFYGNDSKDK